MKTTSSWAPGNGVLTHLPADVLDRLDPLFQHVELRVGQIIYEANVSQHAMFFPQSGIISLLYVLENGNSGEIAMVGNEGLVGVALLVDSLSTPTRAVVQAEGSALVLRSEIADQEFKRGGAFQYGVLRYTQALLTQLAQVAVCNRHHTVERQLTRWLLLGLDCIGDDEIRMTQERIARLLGVRREGVTEAAIKLQEAALIRYSRGTIRVIDREGLLAHSCECYDVVRNEYDRLLGSLNTAHVE